SEELASPAQVLGDRRGHARAAGGKRIGVRDAVGRLAAADVAPRCAVGRIEGRATVDAGAAVTVVMTYTDLPRTVAGEPADVARLERDVVDAPIATAAALRADVGSVGTETAPIRAGGTVTRAIARLVLRDRRDLDRDRVPVRIRHALDRDRDEL